MAGTSRGTTGTTGWRLAGWLGFALLLMACAAPVRSAAAAELVMFDEPGCPWCRKWDQEIGTGYPQSDEGRRAPLRRVHIARAEEIGVRLASPVRATPTFVLVEGGAEVGRITGYPGNEFFWGMLDELLAKLGPGPAPVPAARPIEKPRDARLDLPAAPKAPIVLLARLEMIRVH